MTIVPDPLEVPTLPLWPDVGQILGLGKNHTYQAAEAGEIPVLRFGRSLRVPTAELRRMLRIDPSSGDLRPQPASNVPTNSEGPGAHPDPIATTDSRLTLVTPRQGRSHAPR